MKIIKYILLLWLFYLPNLLSASETDTLATKRFISVGIRSGGGITSLRDSVTNDHLYTLETWNMPYALFFPKNNIGIGVFYELYIHRTNIPLMRQAESEWGVGLIARYYLPFTIKNDTAQRFTFFVEGNFGFTNFYRIDRENSVVSNDIKYHLLRIPVGANLRLFNNFNVQITLAFVQHFPGKTAFGGSIGFEYHFMRKKK